MPRQVWNRNTCTALTKVVLVLLLLVIAAQLVAMTLVVRGQVERAQVRESVRASSSTALRNCIRSDHGKSADDCIASLTVASAP